MPSPYLASPDEWTEIVRLVRSYSLRKYGYDPVGVTIHGSHPGLRHYEPLPPRAPDPPPLAVVSRTRDWASGDEPVYLSDYRAVYWPGAGKFILSEMQAAVVKQLWAAYEERTWEIQQATLLRNAGSDSMRLHDIFKGSTAWGKLVIRGEVPTSYRLPPLPDPESVQE